MISLFITASARVHWFQRRHAPTNILVDRLRSRHGLKWAIPAALILVPAYLYAASVCATIIERGGPGWLNILVLVSIWNALKFAAMAPASLLMLAKAWMSERRRWPAGRLVPMGYEPGRSMGPWTTSA